jgi:3-phenylpropionate/cinnamic acid dioxygenase small subunit
MTLDELLAREAIRQTLVNYNIGGDRLKPEQFLAVFTEDAVFEVQDAKNPVRNDGLPAIRAWFTGWIEDTKASQQSHRATFIRHHLSTCQIDLTGPETAETRTYWTAYTDVGPDHGGQYIDKFRKVGDKWLIAHRRARAEWTSPDSLYVSP